MTYYPKKDGVSIVTTYLAEGLARAGNEVFIATLNDENLPSQEFIHGVDIHRFNLSGSPTKSKIKEQTAYIDFIKTLPVDVIIQVATQCITTDMLRPFLKELKAKSRILYTHGLSGKELKPFKLKGSLYHTVGNTIRWIQAQSYFKKLPSDLLLYDKIICLPNETSLTYFKQFCEEKIYILGNACDDFFYQDNNEVNAIQKYTYIAGDGYFISVANYSDLKNQKTIIKEYLKSAYTNYDLVLIGSSENEYFNGLVKHYGNIPHIHMLTGVARRDLPSIERDAKLFISASRMEAFSISLIEAMAVGLPFISTNVGNAKDLPGGLVANKSTDISQLINKLCSDSQLHKKLSEEGRAFAARNCKIEHKVTQLQEILDSNNLKEKHLKS